MKVLVTDIKIADNKRWTTRVPLVYNSYGCLAKPFLRAEAFYNREVTFEAVLLESKYNVYDTQDETYIGAIADLADAHYADIDSVVVEILAMPQSAMVVSITDDELLESDNDLQQAVFEKLMDHLPVEFLVEHK